MTEVSALINRIKSEFDARDARVKQMQKERAQEAKGREERLELFGRVCEQLTDVWRPRLEAFAQQLGNEVKVTPQVTPSLRQATVTFLTELANVTLKLSASTDLDVRNLVLDYDLQILPILMQYERHARLEMPLDQIDAEKVGAWIDDRLVDCVRTYVSLHENEYYLKRHMVSDPVTGVRFPKHAAAATLEWKGTTYYFISEDSHRDYMKKLGVSAAASADKREPQATGTPRSA